MRKVLLVLVGAVVAVVALAAVKSRDEIGRYRDLSRM
jgi:hypothetical protein